MREFAHTFALLLMGFAIGMFVAVIDWPSPGPKHPSAAKCGVEMIAVHFR
jgi:hypothetical protein